MQEENSQVILKDWESEFFGQQRSCTKWGSRLFAVQCVLKDRHVVLDPRVPLSTLAAFFFFNLF